MKRYERIQQLLQCETARNQFKVRIKNFAEFADMFDVGTSATAAHPLFLNFPKSMGQTMWLIQIYPRGQFDKEARPTGELAIYIKLISCEFENVDLKAIVTFGTDHSGSSHWRYERDAIRTDNVVFNFCRKRGTWAGGALKGASVGTLLNKGRSPLKLWCKIAEEQEFEPLLDTYLWSENRAKNEISKTELKPQTSSAEMPPFNNIKMDVDHAEQVSPLATKSTSETVHKESTSANPKKSAFVDLNKDVMQANVNKEQNHTKKAKGSKKSLNHSSETDEFKDNTVSEPKTMSAPKIDESQEKQNASKTKKGDAAFNIDKINPQELSNFQNHKASKRQRDVYNESSDDDWPLNPPQQPRPNITSRVFYFVTSPLTSVFNFLFKPDLA